MTTKLQKHSLLDKEKFQGFGNSNRCLLRNMFTGRKGYLPCTRGKDYACQENIVEEKTVILLKFKKGGAVPYRLGGFIR